MDSKHNTFCRKSKSHGYCRHLLALLVPEDTAFQRSKLKVGTKVGTITAVICKDSCFTFPIPHNYHNYSLNCNARDRFPIMDLYIYEIFPFHHGRYNVQDVFVSHPTSDIPAVLGRLAFHELLPKESPSLLFKSNVNKLSTHSV